MARLHLRYVSSDTDRHGNVRYYFRKRGQRKIRLPGRPGDPEFMRAYHEALDAAGHTQSVRHHGRPASGTLRALVAAYLASRHYRDLAQSTRNWQRYHLENLCEEALSADDPRLLGDLPADMPPSAVRRLRDRKADASGVQSGNHRLKSMKALYRWGTEQGFVQNDPAREVRKIAAKSEGHHTWTPEEVEQFIAHWPLGSTAHLALSLLLYTGARRSDVVILGRQHVKDGWLVFHPVKNGGRVTVEVPILPELAEAIEAAPTGDLTFLVTAHGKPFSAKGFGVRFRAWCDAADLPHCTAHGLRKAGACLAAENGASEKQLMAIFGWETMQQAELYTRAASRRRLAGDALKLLRRRTEAE